ncbi:MAG TPA: aminotransferase class III-fold pyridoxal phosphate-dependent enzyme [Candidatus Thalassarchaeaceae archaeon]|jgi:acetylornithine/succinyldiaminopimelate/putrescine aminotransferase|nr:aminotransferase class III-fold pyridoxal phosphate-dependent enzyme [Candidatus Thalassarchaeaceae archaeon]|tara:strand:+ start:5493 stop:7010 length:1518 start_codon:yes stop_codon:yes gene_type:complete
MSASLDILHSIRNRSGRSSTKGLPDDVILSFIDTDPSLKIAIDEANLSFDSLCMESEMDMEAIDEDSLIHTLQSDFVNFYSAATVNPYVAISARGPWIITSHGAVIHDNGGYGMLGMGHGPDDVISSMQKNWVMANVMTASFSQKRLADRLKKEIGHTRGKCPFDRFICMNSGSESMTVGMRISDVNALNMTGPGGRHEGKPTRMIAIERAFHGRTDRPAQISHSCKDGYDRNLNTFQNRDNLSLIPANDIQALREAFEQAEIDDVFIELLAIEPVQGEGAPGLCIDRDFYDEARRLTKEHGSMLIIDSVQAGIRGQGCLSIVDYEGFQDSEAPDMEAWSKAINAGQFPLSVVGMTAEVAELYVTGIYGNTMTTNPRALETAIAVLDRITPDLRHNIRHRGKEFVEGLEALMNEFPEAILSVQGTGLLVCAELDPNYFPVIGHDKVEMWCRKNGLGVIHGGLNALRFTPHFAITTEEIDMILQIVRNAIINFSTAKSLEQATSAA